VKFTLKTGLSALLLLLTVSLNALDFGTRVSLGVSSGIGQGWNSLLVDAGSRDYSDLLGTAGIGVFTEFDLSETLFFSPEISLVLNRGVGMRDGSDNSISIKAPGALEMILPLSLEFPLSSAKALRMTCGLQLFISPELQEEIRMNGSTDSRDLENGSPFSAGVILGGGMVFRRDKRVSLITDLRFKLPFTDSISLTASDGSSLHLKTIEVLAGTGIRF